MTVRVLGCPTITSPFFVIIPNHSPFRTGKWSGSQEITYWLCLFSPGLGYPFSLPYFRGIRGTSWGVRSLFWNDLRFRWWWKNYKTHRNVRVWVHGLVVCRNVLVRVSKTFLDVKSGREFLKCVDIFLSTVYSVLSFYCLMIPLLNTSPSLMMDVVRTSEHLFSHNPHPEPFTHHVLYIFDTHHFGTLVSWSPVVTSWPPNLSILRSLRKLILTLY